jgi:hypothetical protein
LHDDVLPLPSLKLANGVIPGVKANALAGWPVAASYTFSKIGYSLIPKGCSAENEITMAEKM